MITLNKSAGALSEFLATAAKRVLPEEAGATAKKILWKDVAPSAAGAAAGYGASALTMDEYSKNYGADPRYGNGKNYQYSDTHDKDMAQIIDNAAGALGHPIKSPESIWNPKLQTAVAGALLANPRIYKRVFYTPTKTVSVKLPGGPAIAEEVTKGKFRPIRGGLVAAGTATAPSLIASLSDKVKTIVNTETALAQANADALAAAKAKANGRPLPEKAIPKGIAERVGDQAGKYVMEKIEPKIDAVRSDVKKKYWPELRSDIEGKYWPEFKENLAHGAVSTLGGLAGGGLGYYGVKKLLEQEGDRTFVQNRDSSVPAAQQADIWYKKKKKRESRAALLGMLASIPTGALGYYLAMRGAKGVNMTTRTKKAQDMALRKAALDKLIEKVGTRIGGTRKEGLEFLVEGLMEKRSSPIATQVGVSAGAGIGAGAGGLLGLAGGAIGGGLAGYGLTKDRSTLKRALATIIGAIGGATVGRIGGAVAGGLGGAALGGTVGAVKDLIPDTGPIKSSAAIKTIEPSSTTSLMNSQSQLRVGLPEMKKSKVATIDATTGATKMAALDKAKLIKLAAMMAKQSAAAAGTSVSVPGAPAKGATASVSTPKAPAAPTTVAQSTTNTMAPDPNTAVV
jgi:hypothetical protein